MGKISIIGGGAAGLACAVMLLRDGHEVTIIERGERLGRKLAASGNGQGNVSNTEMDATHYFSDDGEKVGRALARFSSRDALDFLQSMGGIFLPDARGRIYPAGRQASAVVDLFRRELEKLGCRALFSAEAEDISFKNGFRVTYHGGSMTADAVVLAAGGSASPQFGTDGRAYRLATAFGHHIAPLSPRLVQLKCDPAAVRPLKGIRADVLLTLRHDGKTVFSTRGDLLFADGGISGDAVFRASSHAAAGDTLLIDFLPDVEEARLLPLLARQEEEELLCVVPNGLGRTLYRRAEGRPERLLALLKRFPLTVTGDFGFSRAQTTRGGIPLGETDENLQSLFRPGLFFAGEILNVDGECGGYNLQWAFTSAHLAAEGVKTRC